MTTGFEDAPQVVTGSRENPARASFDAGVPDGTPARRPRITWAKDITPVQVVWAWSEGGSGRIPAGSLSIAAGREGTGKSSWALWVAAHITRGTLPGTFYGTPRPVFYVAIEDSWQHTLVPRLMAAGADLNLVARFDVVTERDEEITLSLPVDNDLLERAVREHGVAAVVIDPLMSAMGSGIDTHKERDVRTALDPLAKLADRTGALIIGIAHFGKSSGTDAASLITGSGAFKNVPRTVFGFAKDEAEGDRVMTQVKNSLGRDNLPSLSYTIEAIEVPVDGGNTNVGRFAFTGESERSVADVLRDGRANDRDDDDPGSRSDAEKFIIEYLTDEGGSAPAKDISAAGIKAGFKDTALTKARFKSKDPVIRSERRGFGKGSVVTWSIDSPIDSILSSVEKPESKESMAESMDRPPATQVPELTLVPTAAEVVKPLPPDLPGEVPHEGPTECPSCGQPTGMALVGTASGLVCRRCAPGVRKGTRCTDCGHFREVVSDGRCNPCHGRAVNGGAA